MDLLIQKCPCRGGISHACINIERNSDIFPRKNYTKNESENACLPRIRKIIGIVKKAMAVTIWFNENLIKYWNV